MQSLLSIIKKLVVNYVIQKPEGSEKEEEKTGVLQDGEASEKEKRKITPLDLDNSLLRPTVPKDYELFLNLTEFCSSVLPKVNTKFFPRWLYIFGKELVIKSNENPLVSGFYKLLSIVMKIAAKERYFDEIESEETMETSEVETKKIAFALFLRFTEEVMVRLKQFKDELLATSLTFVLSLPRIFLDPISLFIPSLQTTLKLGLGHSSLANVALDTIEYWFREKKEKIIEELPRVLPYLNDYLHAQALKETSFDREEREKLIKAGMTVENEKVTKTGFLTIFFFFYHLSRIYKVSSKREY